MNRLNLSLESLTDSHRTSDSQPKGISPTKKPIAEGKAQALAMSELLKPQKRAIQPECEAVSRTLQGRELLEPVKAASLSTGNEVRKSSETGEAFATTCCSMLWRVPGNNREQICILLPRYERDQYLMEWFHRELEFLQGVNSANLLSIKTAQRPRTQTGVERYEVETIADSLETRLARVTRISHLQASVILRDALRSLQDYHSQGKIHAELNPNRILFTLDDRLVLFGSPGYQPNEELRPLGSEDCFAAPELLNPEDFGQITESSDLYCLGHIVLQALLGASYFGLLKVKNNERPTATECRNWHGSNVDQLPALESLLPDAPPTLLLVLEKLTRKERDQRYQTIAEVMADLNATFSKTRKGNLEKKRKPTKPEAFELKLPTSVAGLGILPPPLLNSEEAPDAGEGISRLPKRIMLAGAAFLLVALVLVTLFKPATVANQESEATENSVPQETANTALSAQRDSELDSLSLERSQRTVHAADETETEQARRMETEPSSELPGDSIVNQPELSQLAESVSKEEAEEPDSILTSESGPEESEEGLGALGDEQEEKDFDTSELESSLTGSSDEQLPPRVITPPVANESSIIPGTEPPSTTQAPESDVAPAQPTSNDTEELDNDPLYDHSNATKVFMTRVVQLLDSYQPKSFLKTDKAHAPWFETIAERIDALDSSGVSSEVLAFTEKASESLRLAAGALRAESGTIERIAKISDLFEPSESRSQGYGKPRRNTNSPNIELSRRIANRLQTEAIEIYERVCHAKLAKK